MNWLHTALDICTDGVLTEATTEGLFEYHRFVPQDEDVAQSESNARTIPASRPKTESAPEIDISAIVRRPAPMPLSFTPEHLSPTRILDYIECPAYYLYRHIYALNPATGTVGERVTVNLRYIRPSCSRTSAVMGIARRGGAVQVIPTEKA
jgi:hypothetical protein